MSDARSMVWLAAVLVVAPLAAQGSTQPLFSELVKLPKRAWTCDRAMAVAAVDVDGDGDLDLIVGGTAYLQPGPGLLRNDGYGRFVEVGASALPQVSGNTVAIAAGDLDADGDPDLVFGNQPIGGPGGHGFLTFNDGSGRFGLPQPMPNSLGYDVLAVALADVDGDGDPDIVLGRGVDPALALLVNDGRGGFADGSANVASPGPNVLVTDIAAGDLDGDGDVDLLLAASGVQVMVNDGTGRLANLTPGSIVPQPNQFLRHIATADVDRDGDLDLLGSGGIAGMFLWLNDGKGTFVDVSAAHLPAESARHDALAFLDADEDGDSDVVITADAGGSESLWQNDGAGHFTDASATMLPAVPDGGTPAVAVGDFDGDGDPDLVLPDFGAGSTALCATRLYSNRLRQLVSSGLSVGAIYNLFWVHGRTGEMAMLALATGAGAVPLPPLGVFGLDPTSAVILPGTMTIPAAGWVKWVLRVPSNPSLFGKQVFAQAVLVDPNDPLASRLTNVVYDLVW